MVKWLGMQNAKDSLAAIVPVIVHRLAHGFLHTDIDWKVWKS